MHTLTYCEAIREAHVQLLESDPDVFVLGQGLWSPWYVGATLRDLDKEFGHDRILDSPISENATTGAAIGAALGGMRPIIVHPRMDFMLLATDPIVNQAANWSYIFDGQANVPLVIRAIVNRGGEQGAQHSQALQGLFMHIPGLKIVMPSTPYDAKGLLISAIYDGNPVLYIDDRWLYNDVGDVPDEMYRVPIGSSAIRRYGRDATVVATSFMAPRAVEAAAVLAREGIDLEVIDLRSIKPWDSDCVLSSVRKTHCLIVADAAWKTCGVAAEIAATVSAEAFDALQARIARVCLPDAPAPTSRPLEEAYYIGAGDIAAAVERTVSLKEARWLSRSLSLTPESTIEV
ncbi:MAG TPA: transketolase C-terminal domain-containing protein [Candidatus Acidoferrales bacterium]|nr:transketolase C-terminal domain-containing protein [Candidatus Acidoferrales bacterium]